MTDVLTLDELSFRREAVFAPRDALIIESLHMVDGPFEDWSQVRSPSRARRRLRQGYPQKIRRYYTPKPDFLRLPDGALVGHPATVQALRTKIAKSMYRRADEIAERALFGRPL